MARRYSEEDRDRIIDLGMVGRFDDELRRTLLYYYYYCLVMGDAENAARHLAPIAQPGPRADVKAFRRNVEDVCRRWQSTANFSEFSIGRLILESVSRGVVHRMYFPVEMALMVKAIVTFEGVGNYLKPGFDVATVSRSHINRLFLSQFSPLRVAREGLRGAPELVDALVKAPMLVTEGLRVLESTTRRPRRRTRSPASAAPSSPASPWSPAPPTDDTLQRSCALIFTILAVRALPLGAQLLHSDLR